MSEFKLISSGIRNEVNNLVGSILIDHMVSYGNPMIRSEELNEETTIDFIFNFGLYKDDHTIVYYSCDFVCSYHIPKNKLTISKDDILAIMIDFENRIVLQFLKSPFIHLLYDNHPLPRIMGKHDIQELIIEDTYRRLQA